MLLLKLGNHNSNRPTYLARRRRGTHLPLTPHDACVSHDNAPSSHPTSLPLRAYNGRTMKHSDERGGNGEGDDCDRGIMDNTHTHLARTLHCWAGGTVRSVLTITRVSNRGTKLPLIPSHVILATLRQRQRPVPHVAQCSAEHWPTTPTGPACSTTLPRRPCIPRHMTPRLTEAGGTYGGYRLTGPLPGPAAFSSRRYRHY
jgi:hypothetical protein